MQELEKRKDIVGFFLKKGILLNQDFLKEIENEENLAEIYKIIDKENFQGITVFDQKIKEILSHKIKSNPNWSESEKLKVISGKKKKENINGVFDHLITEQPKPQTTEAEDTYGKVKIVFSYNREPKKREVQDFIGHYNARYKTIGKILRQRQELQNTISISRLIKKKDREQIAVIGMVRDKQYTKNKNCSLIIEDESGYIRAIINKSKPDLFKIAKDVVLDEVIGITGVNGDNVIFVNNLLFPDIPTTKEIKKSKEEAYVLFLSDLHVGSKNFLEEDFNKFLRWINQDLGNESQKDIASKVKYIFVIGDLVDGCGIYPNQDKELKIMDIKDQYKECANLLSQIPKHIRLIICPGNHDAMRVAEPQLPLYKDFSEPLYDLPNIFMVSNPALINIHSSDNFSGFDVLLYHGYSFDFYVAEVESIRNKGGYDRVDLVMRFLLQKRHLAPSHTSTLYAPDGDLDYLSIDKVPDFFVSGHIHKAMATNYRNVTLISGSCWQSKTSFQEKVGHHPEPSRIPIVNLQTRKIKMLKFGE